jgi:Sec-independent protein translocase protein TatA
MFELGPDKLVFVLLAVLIFLGPKELPAMIRTISKWRRQVRSFQDTIRTEIGSVLDLGRGRGRSTPGAPPLEIEPPHRDRDEL